MPLPWQREIALESSQRGRDPQQTQVSTGGHSIRLGASIGVHTVQNSHQATPEEVIRVADEALYRAKDDGRNCVRHSVSAA